MVDQPFQDGSVVMMENHSNAAYKKSFEHDLQEQILL